MMLRRTRGRTGMLAGRFRASAVAVAARCAAALAVVAASLLAGSSVSWATTGVSCVSGGYVADVLVSKSTNSLWTADFHSNCGGASGSFDLWVPDIWGTAQSESGSGDQATFGSTTSLSATNSDASLIHPGGDVTVWHFVMSNGAGWQTTYGSGSTFRLAWQVSGQTAKVADSVPGVVGTLTSPDTPPWCAASDFSDVAASYSSGTFAVRFAWGNPSSPTAGWSVYAPDPGSTLPSPDTVTVTSVDGVDSAPGHYYVAVSLASLSSMTARIVVAANGAGAPGCYVSVAVGVNAISTVGSSVGAPSGNANCGFTLNPIGYLKCMFVPTDAAQEWNGFATTVSGKPPLSFIIGGIPYVSDTINALTSDVHCPDVGAVCLPPFSSDVNGNNSSAPHVDILAGAAQDMSSTWGSFLWDLEALGIWITAFFVMWHRLANSFGGKS